MEPALASDEDKCCLTCTDDSSVLMMATVVLTPAQVEAVRQLPFIAATLHIVQQDRTRTVAEEGLGLGLDGWATSKLLAHHVGVHHVPVIVTHCPPEALVADLYTTLTAIVTIRQTDFWYGCKVTGRQLHRCNYLQVFLFWLSLYGWYSIECFNIRCQSSAEKQRMCLQSRDHFNNVTFCLDSCGHSCCSWCVGDWNVFCRWRGRCNTWQHYLTAHPTCHLITIMVRLVWCPLLPPSLFNSGLTHLRTCGRNGSPCWSFGKSAHFFLPPPHTHINVTVHCVCVCVCVYLECYMFPRVFSGSLLPQDVQ